MLYKYCCKLLSNNRLLPQPVEINRRFDGFTLMYARDGKAAAFKLLAEIARRALILPPSSTTVWVWTVLGFGSRWSMYSTA